MLLSKMNPGKKEKPKRGASLKTSEGELGKKRRKEKQTKDFNPSPEEGKY